MNSSQKTHNSLVKPIAVLISDIHFNLNTLEIASKALKAALDKAAEINLPLIIAGDLQDTKAIIRGEVANRLIEVIRDATTKVYILVGNHDLINEKGEANALEYLRPYATIVDHIYGLELLETQLILIPYLSNTEYLKRDLLSAPSDSILIMHQGFLGAAMGDYIQDKSAISLEVVKDFTVISGHYHRHQTLGTVTYIGSPYTVTFGEANDGAKGFLILNSDGSFTREILNLRKHVIIEADVDEEGLHYRGLDVNAGDLIWLKVRGPYSLLKQLDKSSIGNSLFGHSNFKLDLIANESSIKEESKEEFTSLTDIEVLEALIDTTADTDIQKEYLKKLYKELL